VSNETAFAELIRLIQTDATGRNILATHVDDGRGRCAASVCGAGARDWPCEVHKLATYALRPPRIAS
jgi:hypothetical protein